MIWTFYENHYTFTIRNRDELPSKKTNKRRFFYKIFRCIHHYLLLAQTENNLDTDHRFFIKENTFCAFIWAYKYINYAKLCQVSKKAKLLMATSNKMISATLAVAVIVSVINSAYGDEHRPILTRSLAYLTSCTS